MEPTSNIVSQLEQEVAKAPDAETRLARRMKLAEELGLRQVRYDDSLGLLHSCIVEARNTANRKVLSRALHVCGYVEYLNLDFNNARVTLQEAYELYAADNDPVVEAQLLSNLANVYNELLDFDKALELGLKALDISKQLGDTRRIALNNSNIGGYYNELHQQSKALEYYYEALKLSIPIGDEATINNTLNKIGNNLMNLGENEVALRYLKKALDYKNELTDASSYATTILNVGLILDNLEDCEQALTYIQQSLEYSTKIKAPECISKSHGHIGRCMFKLGDAETGRKEINAAIDLCDSTSDFKAKLAWLNHLIESEFKYGDVQQLRAAIHKWFELSGELGDEDYSQKIWTTLGKICFDEAQYEDAREAFSICADLTSEDPGIDEIAFAYRYLGLCNLHLNRKEEALTYFLRWSDLLDLVEQKRAASEKKLYDQRKCALLMDTKFCEEIKHTESEALRDFWLDKR